MTRRDDRGDDALRDRERRAGDPEQPRRAALLERLPHPLGDLVLALEEAEAAAAARSGPRRSPARRRRSRSPASTSVGMNVAPSAAIARIAPTNDDRDREPAPRDAVLLQPVDGRVERGREEDRDEDPDQDAARRPGRSRSSRRPARMIPSTTRIARGRKRTRRSSIGRSLRSGADGSARRRGAEAGGGNRTLVTSLEG